MGDLMFVYSDEKIMFHHSIDVDPMNLEAHLDAPRAHNRNEILYFISGRASYLVEGSVYKLVPGSIMIMRSGEMHKIIIEENQPYERMALHFDADIVNAIDKNSAKDHALVYFESPEEAVNEMAENPDVKWIDDL